MQGPVFDQKGLNLIAEKLILKEQALLIDSMDTNPYNNSFGDYSIDVLEEALKIHNFHLLRSSDPTDLKTAEAIIIDEFGSSWLINSNQVLKIDLQPFCDQCF